jgi:3-oxoacyl-[acyl-carrier-protein] synthase-1
MSEAIVITAAEAICASGTSCARIYEELRAGHTAFTPLAGWDSSAWPVPVAGGVEKIEAAELFEDRKLLKSIQRLRRTDLLGLYAAARAVANSGIPGYSAALDGAARTEFKERTGVYTGGGGVGYYYQYDFLPALAAADGDLRRFGEKLGATVNPTWLLQSLPNNVLCYLGIAFGFKGANTCITNHGVSGTQAIMEAYYALRGGEADRAVAAGHDSPIEPEVILNLYHLGLLTTDAMRPFDAARSGLIVGEGAAAMVLETQSAARARGARVLGEILGAGASTEASGVLSVRGGGDAMAAAIELALQEAGVTPDDIGMIVAGNGTVASDASEAAAIRRVFGPDMPVVTSFKWAFGHTIAAAGAIDTAIALWCLRAASVPAIATLREASGTYPLNLARSASAPRGAIALVLSRGFGGMNCAVLIKASRDEQP